MAEFLIPDVDGESAAGADWIVEGVEVSIKIGLRDRRVVAHDVVLDVADSEPVEALVGFLEYGNNPFVKRGGTNVDGNATGVDILGSVDVHYLVFGSEAFSLVRIYTRKYVGIRWVCIRGGGRGV